MNDRKLSQDCNNIFNVSLSLTFLWYSAHRFPDKLHNMPLSLLDVIINKVFKPLIFWTVRRDKCFILKHDDSLYIVLRIRI